MTDLMPPKVSETDKSPIRERLTSAQVGLNVENPLLKDLQNALKPKEAESVEKLPQPDSATNPLALQRKLTLDSVSQSQHFRMEILNDLARTISTKSDLKQKIAKNSRGETTIENTQDADTQTRVNFFNNNKNFPKYTRSVHSSLQGSDAKLSQ